MKNRVGETYINNYGNRYTIIEYINCNNITIKFENGYIKSNLSYSNIIKNKIKSPYDKTTCGVGFIGEGEAPLTIIDNEISVPYGFWLNMIKRCYSEKVTCNRPTYKNCTVCEEWHNYNSFYLWYKTNYYEIEGEKMCLDKDILHKGNKVYSPSTCIFVPSRINSLFVSCNKRRGKYPIGVSYNKNNNKYVAQYSKKVNSDNKHIVIGQHDTIEQAFNSYKMGKEKYIKQVADEYKDKIPKKLYDAMYTYKIEITD